MLGAAGGERDLVYVRLPNRTTRGVPAWMFDETICARVRCAERPIRLEDAGRRYGAPYVALATFEPPALDESLELAARDMILAQIEVLRDSDAMLWLFIKVRLGIRVRRAHEEFARGNSDEFHLHAMSEIDH